MYEEENMYFYARNVKGIGFFFLSLGQPTKVCVRKVNSPNEASLQLSPCF